MGGKGGGGGPLEERGTFFKFQVYETIGIPQVEVYEKLRKSILQCGKAQKG